MDFEITKYASKNQFRAVGRIWEHMTLFEPSEKLEGVKRSEMFPWFLEPV